MASIVLLETRAPSKMAGDLTLAGYKAFEALAASEALALCKNGRIDVIVIAADVADPDVAEVQRRYMTIRLKPEATSKDLIWELSQLFPDPTTALQ